MRHLWIIPVVLLLPLCVARSDTPSEDAQLNALFKSHLDRELKSRPLEATRLGDHRFDHQLDDISPKARAAWLQRWRNTLTELRKSIDPKKLSSSGRIDMEIFEHDLLTSIWLAENTTPFETDPLVYNDYLTNSAYILLTQSTKPRAENVKNAAARIAQLPRIITLARENLTKPPKVFAETAIARNKGAIAFFESGIYELAEENPRTSELRIPCQQVVAALKEYQTFLEKTLLPRATGEWRLGKTKFAKKLELELNSGLTAEQVLRDAEAEADRVEREMYTVARQLWSKTFPKKALPPDDATGRRETILQVLTELNKDHGKAEDLVRDVKAGVARLKEFIEKNDILRLPTPDRCNIIEMPEFRRGFSLAYLEAAPPLDTQARSYYAVSPPPSGWDARRRQSVLEEYNSRMLQILTIHEAYPGHYVQLEYSNRHPSQIRRVLQSGVFIEGWAVYTEQMMLDQGYGDGDLALRLMQLKFYLRAVINALLDYRMHCLGWTDEQALELLIQRGFQSEGEAVGKVIRAKLSSCQLSTYFVGRMAHYALRQRVQREMGDRFHLGRFHEAVLDHGSVPVKYLPELVRERLRRAR